MANLEATPANYVLNKINYNDIYSDKMGHVIK